MKLQLAPVLPPVHSHSSGGPGALTWEQFTLVADN